MIVSAYNVLCSVLDSITLHGEMFSWFVAATIATNVRPYQCSTNAISATRRFTPGRQAMIHDHAFSTLTFWKIIVHRCKVDQLELRYIVEFFLALTPEIFSDLFRSSESDGAYEDDVSIRVRHRQY